METSIFSFHIYCNLTVKSFHGSTPLPTRTKEILTSFSNPSHPVRLYEEGPGSGYALESLAITPSVFTGSFLHPSSNPITSKFQAIKGQKPVSVIPPVRTYVQTESSKRVLTTVLLPDYQIHDNWSGRV